MSVFTPYNVCSGVLSTVGSVQFHSVGDILIPVSEYLGFCCNKYCGGMS